VFGVGGEQVAVDEGLQLGGHPAGQLIAADAPAGGAVLFIHSDQPQQLPDHLVAVAAAGGDGLGQRRVGLPGQRAAHPAQLLVARGGEPTAAGDAGGQLL
jgi:hypothetical protein